MPDDMQANLAMLDELGGTKTYNHYPNGWAMAFNTPFKMWKRYEFNGGTADPCIISWPSATAGPGRDHGTSTTTRSTSCLRSWTPSGVERPAPRSRATYRAGWSLELTSVIGRRPHQQASCRHLLPGSLG